MAAAKPDLSDLKRRLGIDGEPKKPSPDIKEALEVAVGYGKTRYESVQLHLEVLQATREMIELTVADALIEGDYESAILKIQEIIADSKECDEPLKNLEEAAIAAWKEKG
jgi:hypothetical protein